MAERIDRVLQGSEAEAREFLSSGELWGRTGSIVYTAGIVPSGEAQQDCEHAFSALGEWQISHDYVNPDVTYWVVFFRERRGLSQPDAGVPAARFGGPAGQAGEPTARTGQPRRTAVPWSVRDVWLGVLAAAMIYAAAWGVVYVAAVSSVGLDLDLWVVVVPTLLELLFLVPVWWFTGGKHSGSLKALGFVSFRPSTLGMGIALLFGYFMFSGIYARLLDSLGLQVQADLTPLVERLATPWPLFVTIVFVAPAVEEIFFRGFVFAGLRARYDWRWAMVISAALFAASHLELTFFIPAFALGCVFAYLYQRSSSVWPGMIMHGVVNALAVTVMYLQL
jgi:uncharacterized protein